MRLFPGGGSAINVGPRGGGTVHAATAHELAKTAIVLGLRDMVLITVAPVLELIWTPRGRRSFHDAPAHHLVKSHWRQGSASAEGSGSTPSGNGTPRGDGMRLEEHFCSTGHIPDAANAVIAKDAARLGKTHLGRAVGPAWHNHPHREQFHTQAAT